MNLVLDIVIILLTSQNSVKYADRSFLTNYYVHSNVCFCSLHLLRGMNCIIVTMYLYEFVPFRSLTNKEFKCSAMTCR